MWLAATMTSTENLDRCFEVALQLVKEAGKIIVERNAGQKKIEQKLTAVDLVTESDKEIERLLTDGLLAQFPHHKFIGEEASSDGKRTEFTDAPTWVIDPIDGTMNFVHNNPHSCISVAFFIAKDTQIGIVYNPTADKLYTARKGHGAWCNGIRLYVSKVTAIGESLVSTEFGPSRDGVKAAVVLDNVAKVFRVAHGIRCGGSGALNMATLATGATDCYYEFGQHIWDIAAGDLLVREAGGVTIDPAGGPVDLLSRRILATSSVELAQAFINILTQFYPQPRD